MGFGKQVRHFDPSSEKTDFQKIALFAGRKQNIQDGVNAFRNTSKSTLIPMN